MDLIDRFQKSPALQLLRSTGARPLLCFLLMLPVGSPAWSQCFTEEQKLTGSTIQSGDHFPFDVAVSGDLAVLSAHRDDDNGMDAGAAYVFRYDGGTWTEEQKLLASDGAPGDFFGRAVSTDGNSLIVLGAYRDDDDGDFSGAAYVFRFNGSSWVEEQKLTANDASAGDEFGAAVDVDGGVIVVGSREDDDVGPGSGSVYVFGFTGTSWVQRQKLLPRQGDVSRSFGHSLSLRGGRIAVGAPSNALPSGFGSAYVFRDAGTIWEEEQKITPSDEAPGDRFGASVSLADDLLVIGAPSADESGVDSGAAYVFRYAAASWTEEAKVTGSDTTQSDDFGREVAASCGRFVVGAWNRAPGAAYLFTLNKASWEDDRLEGSDASGIFGWSVALDHDVAIVGSHNIDCAGYVFRDMCPPEPCDGCVPGTVNSGAGAVTDALFVGGEPRSISIPVGAPIEVTLTHAPAGPSPALYVLWVWMGLPLNQVDLAVGDSVLGCLVNPTPLHPSLEPQPFRCLRSPTVPSIVCVGVPEVFARPARAPWSVTRPQGFPQPIRLTLQGLLADNGAANATGFSVTNAVILRIE